MKRIKIEIPTRLCEYANKVVTSWRIEYIGQGEENDIYYYNLIHKENPKIAIHIEIFTQTQQLYNPESFEKLDNEWVKINLIYPQKPNVIKFIRVDEFKDVKRVFNVIHHAGRQLLQ